MQSKGLKIMDWYSVHILLKSRADVATKKLSDGPWRSHKKQFSQSSHVLLDETNVPGFGVSLPSKMSALPILVTVDFIENG